MILSVACLMEVRNQASWILAMKSVDADCKMCGHPSAGYSFLVCMLGKKAAVLETDLSFTTQRTSVEREYTGCDAAALLLYFISSLVAQFKNVTLVLGFWSSDHAVCAHDATLLGASLKKVGLRRGKETSEVSLIKYKLLTALRPAFNFPRLLLESPF